LCQEKSGNPGGASALNGYDTLFNLWELLVLRTQALPTWGQCYDLKNIFSPVKTFVFG
jgi:hypothetical protein